MNPFTWLRTAAKNAVLGGIEDALAEAAPTLETITVSRRLAIPDAPPIDNTPPDSENGTDGPTRRKKVAAKE